MIKLERLISNSPIPVANNIYFYQGTIQDIVDMGEDTFWSLLRVWDIDRKDLVEEDNELVENVSDFDIWQAVMINNRSMNTVLTNSVDFFLHTKIEFLQISNTIMIGEGEFSTLLTEDIYNAIKDISHTLINLIIGVNEDEQYKETANMSEKEKRLIEKIRKGKEALNRIKNQNKKSEDRLANQIIALVAIGNYTFEQVYNLTLLQLVCLLKKYVDIEQYNTYMTLSPYIDSKKSGGPKHWLDI